MEKVLSVMKTCKECKYLTLLQNGEKYCNKHRSKLSPADDTICCYFSYKQSEETCKSKTNLIKLECFAYGKERGISSDNFNRTKFISINPNYIVCKTDLEKCNVPKHTGKTVIEFFVIRMIDGVMIYCPKSEFEKV